jgi:GntR family transcriptional repressor for pyruvate dehydrogenase complex
MMDLLKPLRSSSLKEVFVQRFEDLILSGQLPIGAKLPPERTLAERLGVSRPVVHSGLIELAARGLVTMKPRVGTVVNDYRREGSLALLGSLVNHGEGTFAPSLLDGLLSMRALLQTEAVRLAANNHGDAELAELESIIVEEQQLDHGALDRVVDLDFTFHHLIAIASGNPIYPMLVKSFEPAERNLLKQFFVERSLVASVFGRHRAIVEAIAARDADRAVDLMTELLDHGRTMLQRHIDGISDTPAPGHDSSATGT